MKKITSSVIGLFLLASASGAAGPPAPSSPQAAADPWLTLQAVRKSLANAGPVQAHFTQTYIPAGFSSGETENGRLSLSLPDCLRWDYLDPTPKGFLLCGELVNAWNDEDKSGRRYRIDRNNEPGLDLLLLGVDELKNRYNATAKSTDGKVEVSLTPRSAPAGTSRPEELTDAHLVVEPSTQRIVQVSYHDREGNLTRFDITGYAPLALQGQFSPPRDIHWEER